jgi:hypothetical protein
VTRRIRSGVPATLALAVLACRAEPIPKVTAAPASSGDAVVRPRHDRLFDDQAMAKAEPTLYPTPPSQPPLSGISNAECWQGPCYHNAIWPLVCYERTLPPMGSGMRVWIPGPECPEPVGDGGYNAARVTSRLYREQSVARSVEPWPKDLALALFRTSCGDRVVNIYRDGRVLRQSFVCTPDLSVVHVKYLSAKQREHVQEALDEVDIVAQPACDDIVSVHSCIVGIAVVRGDARRTVFSTDRAGFPLSALADVIESEAN